MSNKAEWLIWDITESLWWKRIGEDGYDYTESRDDAARFTLGEARVWVDATNDTANDPTVAIVPE